MKVSTTFRLIALIALIASLCACKDKKDLPHSHETGGGELYFPANTATEIKLTRNANHFSVSLCRSEADKEQTVLLTGKASYTDASGAGADASDVFTIPSEVSFAKDERQISIRVNIDFPSLVPDRIYEVEIGLAGVRNSQYGLTKVTISLVFETWSQWEVITGQGHYRMAAMWDYDYPLTLYKRHSLYDADIWQLKVSGPFTDFDYEQIITIDENRTVLNGGNAYPSASSAAIITPENYSAGGRYAYASTDWFLKNVYGPENDLEFTDKDVESMMARQGWSHSYYDPRKGRVNLFMSVYITDPYILYLPGQHLEILQLPGEYGDYHFDFVSEGVARDSAGRSYGRVLVTPAADIDYFTCSFLPGVLEEGSLNSAMQALLKDADAPVHRGSSTIEVTLAGGIEDYTLLVAGYDLTGDLLCTDSKVFRFVLSPDSPEPETFTGIGRCLYTDGILAGLYSYAPATWEVEIQENTRRPGYYRLVKPYASWPLLGTTGYSAREGDFFIYIDATNPACVILESSELCLSGIRQFPEPVVMSQGYILRQSHAYSDAEVIEAGAAGTLRNGTITFPAGSLRLGTKKNPDLFPTNIDPANTSADLSAGTGPFKIILP